MPRKSKPTNEKERLIDTYFSLYSLKNTSVSIMVSIKETIDYSNKEEVQKILPHIQRQMEIINETSKNILLLEKKLSDVK